MRGVRRVRVVHACTTTVGSFESESSRGRLLGGALESFCAAFGAIVCLVRVYGSDGRRGQRATRHCTTIVIVFFVSDASMAVLAFGAVRLRLLDIGVPPAAAPIGRTATLVGH